MNKEKAKQTVLDNFDLNEKIQQNCNELQTIIDYSQEVFEELNYLFETSINYLGSSGNKDGRNAPLAAWRGANLDKTKTKKAFEDLRHLICDGTLILDSLSKLRNEFDLFMKEYAVQLNYMDSEFTKMNVETTPVEQLDYLKLQNMLKRIPSFHSRINLMYSKAKKSEAELTKLRNSMSSLKGTN